jgi:hypothetical protein
MENFFEHNAMASSLFLTSKCDEYEKECPFCMGFYPYSKLDYFLDRLWDVREKDLRLVTNSGEDKTRPFK